MSYVNLWVLNSKTFENSIFSYLSLIRGWRRINETQFYKKKYNE
jgi:hypothetical protein